jgi:16S rRNA C967 or C1407 C5-methylase (RsmB/RsmF family)/NOL1/NOP2/fmu family ribosome biogenesis protein
MRALLGGDQAFEVFGEAVAQLFEERSKDRSLRINLLKGLDAQQVANFGLSLKPISWCPNGFMASLDALEPSSSHPLLSSGALFVQEAGAMEAVEWLNPKPGELVLDLCAAPGAKSTQILEKLAGQGWLVCNEPVRSRAEKLSALTARHGAINSSVYAMAPERIAATFGRVFDAILVDAPCSGESLFAKREERRFDVRDSEVMGCARRQITILGYAAEMLKAGGRLVYSTCTYSEQENEAVVQAFLEMHPSFCLEKSARRWPHIDHVPGGYTVLLVNQSSADNQNPTRSSWAKNEGLVRHGPVMWNGELDVYLAAMVEPRYSDLRAIGSSLGGLNDYFEGSVEAYRELNLILNSNSVELDLNQARTFAQGHAQPLAAPQRGLGLATFRGMRLGPFKAVEGRLNNLFPKILRV